MLPLLRPRALHLDGRNFSSSSWKSTFSSFLHLVFRTRADRRFAVSPLSSEIFFRFTPFLDLSPPETSPLQRASRTLRRVGPWKRTSRRSVL